MSTITNYAPTAVADDGSKVSANKISFRSVETNLSGPIRTFVEANLEIGKFDGTATPTATDDSGDSFGVGSIWVDVSNDEVYFCADNSVGAAVWKQVSNAGQNSTSETSAPVATSDSTKGFSEGSLWVDVTNNRAYINVDAASGSAIWPEISRTTLGRGYIDGFIMTNDTDTVNDISVSVGACRDAADGENIETSAAIVKRIDANWATGTGAGGFPSGLTLTADTWYHMFVIRSSLGVIDAGFDTTSNGANLLTDAANFSEYRRIGSVLTNGSSGIINFVQTGNWFFWNAVQQDVSNTSQSTTEVEYTMSVPPDFKFLGEFSNDNQDNNANDLIVYIHDPDVSDQTAIAGRFSLKAHNEGGQNVASGSRFQCFTNTSSQVAARASQGSLEAFRISTYGYKDSRGKE